MSGIGRRPAGATALIWRAWSRSPCRTGQHHGLLAEQHVETGRWHERHIGRANDTYRVEFYLVDALRSPSPTATSATETASSTRTRKWRGRDRETRYRAAGRAAARASWEGGKREGFAGDHRQGAGRKLAAMIDACLSLSEACTTIAVGTDDDDPERRAYEKVLWPAAVNEHVRHFAGTGAPSRGGRTCSRKAVSRRGTGRLPRSATTALRTQGWDRLLLEALDKLGGEGIVYGNDLHQGEALPTAPVISSGIVGALGWMMEPSLKHMHVDDVWRDLGRAAGCLAYVPEVVIGIGPRTRAKRSATRRTRSQRRG